MKHILFITFCTTIAIKAHSQTLIPPAPTRTVTFTYDDAGNRIQRYIQNPDYLLKQDSVITAYSEGNLSDSSFIRNLDTIPPASMENVQKEAIKVALEHDLNVYPNPTRNSVTVSSSKLEQQLTVSVYDHNGKLVTSEIRKTGSVQVNLSGFADGVYHVFVLLPDNQRLHYKITKAQ